MKSKSKMIYVTGLHIIKKLMRNGFKSYFAGGAIRDRLLGKEYQDIDIVSSAKPKDVKKLFKRTLHVGNAYGVTIVLIKNMSFEVTSFRKDLSYVDGRHPQGIEYADEKEDALRRDFTINGLFYDPINKKILDYVGGKKDIKKKIIRAIGNPINRFEEDKLRILRAIRFSVDLKYKIQNLTWIAIKKLHNKITEVSYERIRDELIKIFKNKNIRMGFNILYQSKLLFILFPDFYNIIKKDKKKLKLLKLFLKEIEGSKKISIGFISFFFFYAKHLPMNIINKNISKLKLSNKQKDVILSIIKLEKNIQNFINLSKAKQLKLFLYPFFLDSLNLYYYYQKAQKKENLFQYILKFYKKEKQYLTNYKSFLNGKDLIKLGFASSPIIGKILLDLENQQLEKIIASKSEAIEWVKKNYLN